MAPALFVLPGVEVIAHGVKGKAAAGFDYSSSNAKWRGLRERALRRDGYLCRNCRRYGRQVEATTAHHAWPVEDWPEYSQCLWNLVALCDGCHELMHDRRTRQLTALGESWRRKISPPPPSP